MKIRLAYLLMDSPAWLWRRYPTRVRDWAIDQHMLTFESVRRLRGLS